MKHLLIISTLVLCYTLNVNAQREPAVDHLKEITVERGSVADPPGADAAGNKGSDRSEKAGKAKESKPGKDKVSSQVKKTVSDIKKSNSVDGKGKIATEVQRKEIIRQLDAEKAIAARDGRKADANFIEKEKQKIKELKLTAPANKATKVPSSK